MVEFTSLSDPASDSEAEEEESEGSSTRPSERRRLKQRERRQEGRRMKRLYTQFAAGFPNHWKKKTTPEASSFDEWLSEIRKESPPSALIQHGQPLVEEPRELSLTSFARSDIKFALRKRVVRSLFDSSPGRPLPLVVLKTITVLLRQIQHEAFDPQPYLSFDDERMHASIQKMARDLKFSQEQMQLALETSRKYVLRLVFVVNEDDAVKAETLVSVAMSERTDQQETWDLWLIYMNQVSTTQSQEARIELPRDHHFEKNLSEMVEDFKSWRIFHSKE